jgi:hypothetical protein
LIVDAFVAVCHHETRLRLLVMRGDHVELERATHGKGRGEEEIWRRDMGRGLVMIRVG